MSDIWLMSSPRANHYVDVTETFALKLAAVRAHRSQVAHRERLAETLRSRTAAVAAAGSLPEGRLAEAFQVVANR